ncbi:MAG: hypothetical protein JNL01_05150 [Bdellovibrionales bacterium]|nr:hypothetical protein [Bdellovibrionales bacterium]
MGDELPEDVDSSMFESMKLVVTSVVHAHTKVAFKDPSQFNIIEFSENELLIELPSKSYATGHYLMINLEVKGSKTPFKTLEIEGKIESLENLDGADQIRFSMSQFDHSEWDKIRAAFSSRQADIQNFFASVKGY